MSALGQKRTFAPQTVMSAISPKADMCGATTDVCFGPEADIGRRLFNHIISGQKNAVWYRNAKRFGGLEIDH
jgi:hypothetical protein